MKEKARYTLIVLVWAAMIFGVMIGGCASNAPFPTGDAIVIWTPEGACGNQRATSETMTRTTIENVTACNGSLAFVLRSSELYQRDNDEWVEIFEVPPISFRMKEIS